MLSFWSQFETIEDKVELQHLLPSIKIFFFTNYA